MCCIKMAKYYEFTEHDVVGTVLTDSAVMYGSRIEELNAEGAYRERDAAVDYNLHLAGPQDRQHDGAQLRPSASGSTT